MMTKDVGDEETLAKGGEEGSKETGAKRNNDNDSMWPRSGLQA